MLENENNGAKELSEDGRRRIDLKALILIA